MPNGNDDEVRTEIRDGVEVTIIPAGKSVDLRGQSSTQFPKGSQARRTAERTSREARASAVKAEREARIKGRIIQQEIAKGIRLEERKAELRREAEGDMPGLDTAPSPEEQFVGPRQPRPLSRIESQGTGDPSFGEAGSLFLQRRGGEAIEEAELAAIQLQKRGARERKIAVAQFETGGVGARARAVKGVAKEVGGGVISIPLGLASFIPQVKEGRITSPGLESAIGLGGALIVAPKQTSARIQEEIGTRPIGVTTQLLGPFAAIKLAKPLGGLAFERQLGAGKFEFFGTGKTIVKPTRVGTSELITVTKEGIPIGGIDVQRGVKSLEIPGEGFSFRPGQTVAATRGAVLTKEGAEPIISITRAQTLGPTPQTGRALTTGPRFAAISEPGPAGVRKLTGQQTSETGIRIDISQEVFPSGRVRTRGKFAPPVARRKQAFLRSLEELRESKRGQISVTRQKPEIGLEPGRAGFGEVGKLIEKIRREQLGRVEARVGQAARQTSVLGLGTFGAVKTITGQLPIAGQLPKAGVLPGIKQTPIQQVKPIPKQPVTPIQKVLPKQKVKEKPFLKALSITDGDGFKPIPVPKVGQPLRPLPFLPILPSGQFPKKRRAKTKRGKKVKREFTPSLTAIGLGITAKVSKKSFTSGLGIRPIPIRKKKRSPGLFSLIKRKTKRSKKIKIRRTRK